MNQQPPARIHPVKQLRKDMSAVLPTLGLKATDQERMQSVLMIAVERDPQLISADRQSLIASIRQCANHGLVPDGNEAMLQVYKTRIKTDNGDQWIQKVQYQQMVRGIVNRVLNSGKIKTFWADVVYGGEKFHIDASDGERRPIHEKQSEFSRGADADIVGAYSVAKFVDGTVDCEPMSREEIEKVRRIAKTQKVWDSWFTEKAKVAVLRRHSKRLPLSSEDLDMILNRDESDMDAPVRDVTPKPKTTLAQRLTAEPEEAPEPVSGEIVADEDVDQTPVEDTDEYHEGVEAAAMERAADSNPYQDDMVLSARWLKGFKDGQRGQDK